MSFISIPSVDLFSAQNVGGIKTFSSPPVASGLRFNLVPSSDINTLDYYEEGTFTPTIRGTSSSGVFTYTSFRFGKYQRIGNRVFITGRLAISAITTAPTGTMLIGGMPFINNDPAISQPISVSVLTNNANVLNLLGFVGNGANTITLCKPSVSGIAVSVPADIGNNLDLFFFGAYLLN